MTTATVGASALTKRLRTEYGAATHRPSATAAALDTTMLVAAYDAHRSTARRIALPVLSSRPAAEDAFMIHFSSSGSTPSRTSRRVAQCGGCRSRLPVTRRSTACEGARGVSGPRTAPTRRTPRSAQKTRQSAPTRIAMSAMRSACSGREQRRAIAMADCSGLTRRHDASEMTVPVGTVKSRMRLGMRTPALAQDDRAPGAGFDGGARRPVNGGSPQEPRRDSTEG